MSVDTQKMNVKSKKEKYDAIGMPKKMPLKAIKAAQHELGDLKAGVIRKAGVIPSSSDVFTSPVKGQQLAMEEWANKSMRSNRTAVRTNANGPSTAKKKTKIIVKKKKSEGDLATESPASPVNTRCAPKKNTRKVIKKKSENGDAGDVISKKLNSSSSSFRMSPVRRSKSLTKKELQDTGDGSTDKKSNKKNGQKSIKDRSEKVGPKAPVKGKKTHVKEKGLNDSCGSMSLSDLKGGDHPDSENSESSTTGSDNIRAITTSKERSKTICVTSSTSSSIFPPVLNKQASADQVPATPVLTDENPLKTRYVTITSPHQRFLVEGNGSSSRRLPKVDPSSADWLFKPEDSKHRLGALGIAGSIRRDILEHARSSRQSLNKGGGCDNASLKGSGSMIAAESISDQSREFAQQFVASHKQKAKSDPKIKLTNLMNLDPRKEREKLDDKEIRGVLGEHPELCSIKFALRSFEGEHFPFTILCALGASVTTLKRCFKANPKALLEQDGAIGTPMHYACAFRSSAKIVEYLIHKDEDFLEATNKMKRTPLHMACMHQAEMDVVSALIDENPMVAQKPDKEGMTPLHLACQYEADWEIVTDLVQEYPQACLTKSKAGETPLHLALSRKVSCLPVIKALLKAKPQALELSDDKGRLPLHTAIAYKADRSILKMLVKKYPASLDKKNKLGESPSEFAKRMQYSAAVVKWLSPSADSSDEDSE